MLCSSAPIRFGNQASAKSSTRSSTVGPLPPSRTGGPPCWSGFAGGGKRGVLGAMVGQVMRETRGRANPKLVSDLLERAIKG